MIAYLRNLINRNYMNKNRGSKWRKVIYYNIFVLIKFFNNTSNVREDKYWVKYWIGDISLRSGFKALSYTRKK